MARDRATEQLRSIDNTAVRLGQLVDDRNTGKLGEDYIKLAQVMLLCTLPYSRTSARQVSREARLPSGFPLRVTFLASKEGVDMPFGADRRLLAWLLDRAMRSESPFIPWNSAWEYQREIGLPHGGSGNKNLQRSFERLSGLGVRIDRRGSNVDKNDSFFFFRKSWLPRSIDAKGAPKVLEIDDPLPGNGILIDPVFHSDMRRKGYHAVVPRSLWLQVKGNSQVQDMMLFLYWRCYAAESESVVPWAFLAQQFGPSSNPRRQISYAKEALKFLCHLWRECPAEAIETGILVRPVKNGLLPDDPTMKRVRLLNP